jgi:NAD+ diphosphatase
VGLWFAFRGRDLLVLEGGSLPRGTAAEVGLAPVRTELVGHLHAEPCYAAELPASTEPPAQGSFRGLRELYAVLPDELMRVAVRAVQVMEWDRTHQFCGACGTPTEADAADRARVCPRCRLSQYPRVSPAVIVAVERGPELLLAHAARFPQRIFSVLAGFVDPGESAEDAVHREIFEEAGVTVTNLRYFGSQAWPFPHSLMLGFQADHLEGEVVPDGEELLEAGFFPADALPPLFPGRVSIAQWLIHDFLRRHGKNG